MQRSGGKLLLLSLKIWGTNAQNKAGIGVDLLMVMVLLALLVVMLTLPLVPLHVIFRLSKKKRGSHDSRVLLPLNLHGFIHKTPKN